ncbi:hypothetical protein GWK47_003868 [Chionoecetes opilio]|uniref:Uncharacterized protein n=1 Tax=Chionoecetes opilio TaxID=41210 RepID=A0A8J5D180_CHIOP|nr:hypothetical protein GWK47_003868 [Chionoecetes opilio]
MTDGSGNDPKWVAAKAGPSTPSMWWTSATGLYTGEHVARTRGRSCVWGRAAVLPPTHTEYHTWHQSPYFIVICYFGRIYYTNIVIPRVIKPSMVPSFPLLVLLLTRQLFLEKSDKGQSMEWIVLVCDNTGDSSRVRRAARPGAAPATAAAADAARICKAHVMERKYGYISLVVSSLHVLVREAHCHSVKTLVLNHIKREPNTKGL